MSRDEKAAPVASAPKKIRLVIQWLQQHSPYDGANEIPGSLGIPMSRCDDVTFSTLLNAGVEGIYFLVITLEDGIPASIAFRIVVKGL